MSEGGGWNFLKVLGVIVGLVGMVGFGLCSLLGFALGGIDSGVALLALLGAALSALCLWGVVAIFRSTRKSRGPNE